MSSARSLRIRRAEPGEAPALAELQNRSSTHWGYPSDYFDWAPEAHVIPESYVRDNLVYVLVDGETAIGFYGFTEEDGELLLDKLFVDVDQIGKGYGKLLWRHAVQIAREQGRADFIIGSDPNAASFYAAMGAAWYAEKPTAEPTWTVQMFRYAIPPESIRPATLDEAGILHNLTQRSIMHWGYPPEFLEWEPEAIAVTPAFLEKTDTWVLEQGDGIIGYYSLMQKPDGLFLDKLFVEPGWISTGLGKRLYLHAIGRARSSGATELMIDADPNAAPFYRAMGGIWVEEVETSWPDWRLQVFRVPLVPENT